MQRVLAERDASPERPASRPAGHPLVREALPEQVIASVAKIERGLPVAQLQGCVGDVIVQQGWPRLSPVAGQQAPQRAGTLARSDDTPSAGTSQKEPSCAR